MRNRVIAWAFGLTGWWVRLRHAIRSLGRPRVGGVDHVTLPVRDLGVAARFYREVLGAAHLGTFDDAELARFGRPPAPNGGEGAHHVSLFLGDGVRVDLFLQRSGQASADRGHPHHAFRVTPRSMPWWKARLEAAGVPTEGPLRLGPPGQASLYFNDPDGNHLELTCMGYPHEIPLRPPDMARLVWGAEPARLHA